MFVNSELYVISTAAALKPVILNDEIEQLMNEDTFRFFRVLRFPRRLGHLLAQEAHRFLKVFCAGGFFYRITLNVILQKPRFGFMLNTLTIPIRSLENSPRGNCFRIL